MDSLQVYAFIAKTRVLGPFERFALWLQGCPFRCRGCMTPDALPMQGGQLYQVDALAEKILATCAIEGLTLTGGEPFAQAQVLAHLLRKIKKSRDLGVIIYSGYRLSQLQKKARNQPEVTNLLSQTDLLVDGLYRASHNDGQSLRGSANQQVHCLTPRYQTVVNQHYHLTQRQVEIHLEQNHPMLVGIPGSHLLQQWQAGFQWSGNE